MIRLFELRTEKGLSQREMAKLLNVSQGTYNNWENGKTQPAIEQLIALSHVFEVSVDFLIGNSDDYGNINIQRNISERQLKLIENFDKLSEKSREAVETLIENLS